MSRGNVAEQGAVADLEQHGMIQGKESQGIGIRRSVDLLPAPQFMLEKAKAAFILGVAHERPQELVETLLERRLLHLLEVIPQKQGRTRPFPFHLAEPRMLSHSCERLAIHRKSNGTYRRVAEVGV